MQIMVILRDEGPEPNTIGAEILRLYGENGIEIVHGHDKTYLAHAVQTMNHGRIDILLYFQSEDRREHRG